MLVLKNYYWFFKGALPPRKCEEIKKAAEQHKKNVAITGAFKNQTKLSKTALKQLHKKRKSNVAWMNDPWLYNLILPYIKNANENAGWNFEFSWSESFQFTEYKKGQYYGWHQDQNEATYDSPDPNFHGKTRKVSAIIQLTDPKKYKGGEIEFDFRNSDPELNKKKTCSFIACDKGLKQQGTILVFPSFLWHRVKEVTSGTRHSLVVWNIGWPFK